MQTSKEIYLNISRFLKVSEIYCCLATGEGFTIFIDIDRLPHLDLKREFEAASQAGSEEIVRRLEPIAQVLEKLGRSLKDYRQMFYDQERGDIAFDLSIQWTDEQLGLLAYLERMMSNLDCLIKLPY